MNTMENNNKESFKLLARTGSGSDSNSEVPEFVLTPKRKRLKRRVRANHVVTRTQQSPRSCGCGGRTVSLVLAAVLLTCWLFTLSWLAVVLHGELQRLDDMVRRVEPMDRGEAVRAGAGAGPSPGAAAVSGGGAGAGGAAAGGGHTKKMKKRRELDALAKRSGAQTANGHVHRRSASGGVSSHDQLLSETSDEDSAPPGYGPGYAPGYVVKRTGHHKGSRHPLRRRHCVHAFKACTLLLIFACVIATTTVMWLFIDVREQVSSLRTQIEQVVAGSEGVPDDLQKIHSLSRALQQNQTQLSSRTASLAAQVANITEQIAALQSGVRTNTEHLQSNPEPVNGKELLATVAQWGSQIKDLDNTVRTLKQQGATLDTLTQLLTKNLTAMEASITQLSNISLRPSPIEPNVAHMLDSLQQSLVQVAANLTETNLTLSKRLQWLQDDQGKDHKTIEGLQEMGQNVTARVRTLEGECAKNDVQSALNTSVTRLAEQLAQESERLKLIESSFSQLQASSGTAQPGPSVLERNSFDRDHTENPSDSASLVEGVHGSTPATSLDDEKGSPIPGG